MKRMGMTALAITLVLAACATGAPIYTAEPFSAQVVDGETGLPIAGAVVVANWELVVGGLDGPRHMGQLEVKETVTDEQGRFSFAGFTRLNPSLGELRFSDPRVIVFMGGYEAGVYYSPIVHPRNLPGPTRKAAVDGKVLKLARVKPEMFGPKGYVRPEFHFLLPGYVRGIISDCQWHKMPRLLTAMNDERARLLTLDPKASAAIGIERLGAWAKPDCKLTHEALRGYSR